MNERIHKIKDKISKDIELLPQLMNLYNYVNKGDLLAYVWQSHVFQNQKRLKKVSNED